jgi:hypothetical protein
MPTETYHGHEISYGAAGAEARADEGAERAAPSLQINGRDYEVIVHSDGTYSAREYYFDKFGSLQALGRAIARTLPDRSPDD